jgi:hypothetical protein
MTFRIAVRSFAAQPVRSVVLVCGFGFGITCMASLLGVGEVILEQSRSPHLRGGGDLVVYGAGGRVTSARFLGSQLIESPPLAGRATAASPSLDVPLYLVRPGGPALRIHARGGIPSLERALGDPETSTIAAWRDTPADREWASPDPGDVLRAMDRFHPIPDVPARADSWAEWLYFNGRSGDTRFYLSFLVGPRSSPGRRSAHVRLQLERDGRLRCFADRDEIAERLVRDLAPDLRIGSSRVRLEGLRYRIELALYAEDRVPRSGQADLTGEIVLEAVPGRSLPPFEVSGAGGWVSGYVVPVLSGRLDGRLLAAGESIPLVGGRGYHDHNWGFWGGVTWQWGQVAGEDLSLLYGRIRPPADAADAERIPGFLVVLGPDGPLGFATDVAIEERDDASTGLPSSIFVAARGAGLDIEMQLDVTDTIRTAIDAGPEGGGAFVQMQARYRVTGSIGKRVVDFAAPGAAETFRGPVAGR